MNWISPQRARPSTIDAPAAMPKMSCSFSGLLMAVPGNLLTSDCVVPKTPPRGLPTSCPMTKKPGSRLAISASALAITIDVGAARVRINQADLQMQYGRAFGAHMFGQRTRGFIEGDGIAAVHLHGFGPTTTSPFHEAAPPLFP